MTTVLLPPFPFDHRMWDDVVAHLPEPVIAVDYVVPDGPPSIEALARSVWRQLPSDAVPTLVGISLGGYVALEMMRQRPISALALVDTKVSADTDEGRITRERLALSMEQHGALGIYAEQALPALLGEYTRTYRRDVVAKVGDWIREADPHVVAWLARAMAERPDSAPDLATFDGPVLIMRGEQDTISTEIDLAAMLTCAPSATVVTINNCGHLPPIEDVQATAVALSSWGYL
jgi:pimeloyl-ACP methyl ester carboxylesterase